VSQCVRQCVSTCINIYVYNYIHICIYIKEPYPQKGSCISAKETYVSVKEPKLFIKEACKSEEENCAVCCPTLNLSIEKFTSKVLVKRELQFGHLALSHPPLLPFPWFKILKCTLCSCIHIVFNSFTHSIHVHIRFYICFSRMCK